MTPKAIIKRPTPYVLRLVSIMKEQSEWKLADILAEYRQRYPDDPCSKNRGAAIRNQLQRYCLTARQYQQRNPPVFENPAKGVWRLVPEYRVELVQDHIPDAAETDLALAVS